MNVEVYPLHWLQSGAIALGLAPLTVQVARWSGLAAAVLLIGLCAVWPRRQPAVRRAILHALAAGGLSWLLAVLVGGAFPIPHPAQTSGGLVQPLVPTPASSAFPARSGAFLFGAAAGLWGAGGDAVFLGMAYAVLAALAQMAAGLEAPSDELGALLLGVSSTVAVLLAQGAIAGPIEALLRLGGWKVRQGRKSLR